MVGIGAVAFFLFCYQLTRFNDASRATTSALLSAALAGACAGFLVHNFHPARLFMGDSGSMLIGLVLSASAVTLTGQFAETDLSQGAAGSQASLLPTLMPLLLPISLLVVPMLDLVMAVIEEPGPGRSPFAPDKQHLHHRLLEIGHSSAGPCSSCGCGRSGGLRHGARESLHRTLDVDVAGRHGRADDHPHVRPPGRAPAGRRPERRLSPLRTLC